MVTDKHTWHAISPDDLEDIAKSIIENAFPCKVFLLEGSMGAGKTTLVKSLCRVVGVTDLVNSPTFTIVNEYITVDGKSVFHFDLFRIKSTAELLDIGFEDYLYSDCYCFIEWPSNAINLMPENACNISIQVSNDYRVINLNL